MKKRSLKIKKCNIKNTEKLTHTFAHNESTERKTAWSESIGNRRYEIVAERTQTHIQINTAQQVSEHALRV